MKVAGVLMFLAGVLLILRGGRVRSGAWILLGVAEAASGAVLFWVGARQ